MNSGEPTALTLADFEAAGWAAVIDGSPKRTCLHYAELFQQKFADTERAGGSSARVYQLLMEIGSMVLDSRSVDQPYRPRFPGPNGRSAIPEDIAATDVALFKDLALSIKDAEMRARLADLSWILTRQHDAAELATASYLESAKTLEDPAHPTDAVHRIERALRLAAQLQNQELMSTVAARAGEILDRRRSEFPFRLAWGLLEVLSDFHLGDAAKYARFADEYATRAESQSDFDNAHDFWRLKAKWFDSRSPEYRAALIAAAETHVKKIDLVARSGMPPNHLTIADLLERAIHAHRSISGQRERVAELHQRLLSIQPEIAAQMPRIELASMDVSEMTQRAISRVRGKPLSEAFLGIATLLRPPEPKVLRERVLENMKFAPLSSGLPRVFVNSSGKTVAKSPSALSSDETERELAILQAMRFELGLYTGLTAHVIAAARSQVVLEHPMTLRDWDSLLMDNPFIPAGRERIFAEGLRAGLMGNLLVAVHLLIPQFENSIRELLFRAGEIASKYDKDGIQDEKHIQQLLYMPKFEQLFGPAITFDLKTLLVEHGGPNLRHATAHGLRSAAEFSTADALYFWSRILGFCIPDLLRHLVWEAQSQSAPSTSGSGAAP